MIFLLCVVTPIGVLIWFDLPLTILGGAGGTEDVGLLTRQFGIIGAASGSQFVYKGKLKGVLMHYPDAELKSSITKFTSLK